MERKRRNMAKKYSCKVCGAELYFDPKKGKLHCEYCGSDFDPSEYDMTAEEETSDDETIAQGGNDDDEPAHAEGNATDDSISLDDLVVYKCPHCAAEVITSKKTVATTCVYCNRAITLAGNVKGAFRPDYVLPFETERKDVEAEYLKLAKGSFLTPRLFIKNATVEKIKGMYVPFWLYSFEGRSVMNVSAEKLHVYMSGEDEITEHSRYEIHEEGQGSFDRVPADAMKEMDNTMMDSIEPFDFKKLVPFNPAYLAGFYTQQWDEDAAFNEPRAKARAKEALSSDMMAHIGTFSSVQIRNENYFWKDHGVEQVMLPVWMLYMDYKDKKYVFAMNGQTGKIMGTLPKDMVRLFEAGGVVFVVCMILLMILRILGVMI